MRHHHIHYGPWVHLSVDQHQATTALLSTRVHKVACQCRLIMGRGMQHHHHVSLLAAGSPWPPLSSSRVHGSRGQVLRVQLQASLLQAGRRQLQAMDKPPHRDMQGLVQGLLLGRTACKCLSRRLQLWPIHHCHLGLHSTFEPVHIITSGELDCMGRVQACCIGCFTCSRDSDWVDAC